MLPFILRTAAAAQTRRVFPLRAWGRQKGTGATVELYKKLPEITHHAEIEALPLGFLLEISQIEKSSENALRDKKNILENSRNRKIELMFFN